MRAYDFMSSCHSGDIIVAVMDSHMIVVTSSNVCGDVRHVVVMIFDTASSIMILHTSMLVWLVLVWLVEGSGLSSLVEDSGWLAGRSGIRTAPPSVGRSSLETRTTSVVSSPPPPPA